MKKHYGGVPNASRGFTLVEMIMGITILSIAILALLLVVGQAAQKSAQPELLSTATHLAEGEMERVGNLRYSQIVNQAPAAFAAPFADYTYEVTVSAVPPCPCPPGLADDPAMNQYKQVNVIIRHASQGGVTLTTIVMNQYS